MDNNPSDQPQKQGINVTVPKLAAFGVAVAAVAVGCTLLLRPATTTVSGTNPSATATVDTDATKATVPNVVGLERQHAEKNIANSLLDVGTKTEEYSDVIPGGNVISQEPAAGTVVDVESKVNLVISKGRQAAPEVTMPDLMGKTRQEAEQALRNAKLIAVQDDSVVTSDFKPGTVCRQSVKAGTKLKQDTHVSYATAVAPVTNRVTVPNLAGKKLDDARKELGKAELGVDTAYAYSDRVPKDVVMRQSIDAGKQVSKGTVVTLSVSLGAKPSGDVVVPDVVGTTSGDATKALKDAGLKADTVGTYSDKFDKDVVMDQSVAAGTKVAKNTPVTIEVSLGKKPAGSVVVPDLANMIAGDAENALKDAKLTPDRDEAYSDEVEKDHVLGQSLAAGTKVAEGTQVTYTVSLGKKPEPKPEPKPKVQVPDIMTYTRDEAIEAIQSAGLVERWSGEEDGTVIAQDPAPGTEVEQGSVVTFTLEHVSSKVEVPDVAGMTADDAAAKIDEAGITLEYDHDRGQDTLDGTDPVAGALVDKGTTVAAVFHENPEPEQQSQPEPEQQPEQQAEPEQQPEAQPEPKQQPEAQPEPKQEETKPDQQGSKPTDADRKIFQEAMDKADGANYELVSKLSAQAAGDGTDYTFLCTSNGEQFHVIVHEGGVDNSTATLVTATKVNG